MPEIKLQDIVSVSSEDKGYPAENLLKSDGFKKWRSASAGEKQVSVTIQFAKAEKINQVDIGNNGSAFVEVLVGKSSSKDEEFQVLLVASSFSSPSESRTEQNLNRVRMFASDKLSKAVQGQKWDRVKVICTQPFNKSLCYGLSFIKFHSEGDGTPQNNEKIAKLGAFTLKDQEEDTDDIQSGSLFAKRRKSDEGDASKLSAAAQVRQASRAASAKEKSSSTYTEQRESTKRKLSIEGKDGDSKGETSNKTVKTQLRKQSTSLSSVSSASSSSKKDTPPLKKTKTEPGKYSKDKQFTCLMENVVFVLSGFQNPERGKIRDRALEMGAQYKPDWVKGCTHLISAFANTPKFNAVKGKGRIVSKGWIRDCYKEKKLFPWRNYRLGNAPSPANSSDSETEDFVHSKPKTPSKTDDEGKKQMINQPKEDTGTAVDDEEIYGGSTDCESDANTDANDTDDEIEEIKKTDSKVPTDVKNELESELPILPSFFKNKCFLFYGKFDETLRRTLFRFIIAYNGSVEDYMADKVTHVLTSEGWDQNFDDALGNNSELIFVKPTWVLACDEMQKLVPYQKYAVAPN